MKDNQNAVLVFKAISDDLGDKDPYVKVLADKGFSVQTIPVLEFKFKNLIVLKEKLDRPDRYGGLILSNPRCVQAVADAVGDADELPDEWRELPVFAVGETTARQAKDLLNICTTTSGNVATLTTMIVKKRSLNPLLLPTGNIQLDTMDRLLTKQGVATDMVEVYTTVPHPQIEENLQAALEVCIPHYVVYFSPSGVHSSYPILKEAVDVEETKWISIGPTTGAAIESHGLKVSASASKPTPDCLAEAIASCAPRQTFRGVVVLNRQLSSKEGANMAGWMLKLYSLGTNQRFHDTHRSLLCMLCHIHKMRIYQGDDSLKITVL